MAVRKIVWTDSSLRYTLPVVRPLSNLETTNCITCRLQGELPAGGYANMTTFTEIAFFATSHHTCAVDKVTVDSMDILVKR